MSWKIHLDDELKQEILNTIYGYKTHIHDLRPVTLVDIHRLNFFDMHDNRFDGWIATATYADGLLQEWLIVVLDDGELYLEFIP